MSNIDTYPSSEDTHLLLDVLIAEKAQIQSSINRGGICIEIGCGSGEVSLALQTILPHAFILSTDVNWEAVIETKELVSQNRCEVAQCDLFAAFRTRPFLDVIVFNPPYVPTDDKEYEDSIKRRDISASWAGGRNGRIVIDRFLQAVPAFLTDAGVAYLVAIELNNIQDILQYAARFRLTGEIVGERLAGIERLFILRFRKEKQSKDEET